MLPHILLSMDAGKLPRLHRARFTLVADDNSVPVSVISALLPPEYTVEAESRTCAEEKLFAWYLWRCLRVHLVFFFRSLVWRSVLSLGCELFVFMRVYPTDRTWNR